MKHAEEIMKILEAFDLTQSYRAAGELAGSDHHTAARWEARRDAGELTASPVRRPQLIDELLAKVEEWMEASDGKIRADVAYVDDAPAGWTRVMPRSALPAVLANRALRRVLVDDPGAWWVACFVVDRRQRTSGVANASLTPL